jgi:peptide-methionine (R)-S-oxide reductase
MKLSDAEWRKKLTSEQYKVLRQKGTEAPFSGEYVYPRENGSYTCVACGSVVFDGNSQFESDLPGLRGWPSFSDVASSDAVELQDDNSLGMHRIEVVCKKCGGHLGHLFDDDKSKTGKHYCINSCALNFKSKS